EFNIGEVVDNIYELQLRGIIPIIAHPERYIQFIKSPILINKFIKEGFLFQLNSGSLVGHFGKAVKKLAETFVKNKIYSFIGSDGHRDEKRDTNLKLGTDKIQNIHNNYTMELEKNGELVIENGKVEFSGKEIKEGRKKFLGIF
ncbi:MAG: CpsB/CapC family capsule biosynthesis tyrosine phosphatase, partial [Clostridium sp.]